MDSVEISIAAVVGPVAKLTTSVVPSTEVVGVSEEDCTVGFPVENSTARVGASVINVGWIVSGLDA